MFSRQGIPKHFLLDRGLQWQGGAEWLLRSDRDSS